MDTIKLRIADDGRASSCFFRSVVAPPHRKALLKVTDRCNLRCAHCFVSADSTGDDMPLDGVRGRVIPQLAAAHVRSVTLTGGEPFAHPELMPIVRALRTAGMSVSICTNGTHADDAELDEMAALGDINFNVSLDGFSPESHGRFRGDRGSFAITVANARRMASRGLLKGLLATPNRLARSEEYEELCRFAKECGARYVLMNPLSSFGRGVTSKRTLAAERAFMSRVATLTAAFTDEIDVVQIRFPNDDGKPLGSCHAGNIIYVFPKGDVTVCPYLVFAAEVPGSGYSRDEFIVGNALKDDDLAARLDAYRLDTIYRPGDNATCRSCSVESSCGKGCPAAVIAAGGRLGDVDTEVCPKVNAEVSVA